MPSESEIRANKKALRIASLCVGIGYRDAGAAPIRARLQVEGLLRKGNNVVAFGMRLTRLERMDLPVPYTEIRPWVAPRPFASLTQWSTYEYLTARAVLREHRRTPFHLILDHTQYGLARRLLLRRLCVPWISVVHRTIFDLLQSGCSPYHPWLERLYEIGGRYEMRHSDGIIALHQPMKDEIIRETGVPEERIRVIPNGVALARESFEELQRDRESNTILYAGRLSSEKCVDVLLRAFAKTRTEGARLRIVGDTPVWREKLEAMAAELNIKDRVKFTGAMTHEGVLAEMRRAGIFVLPSASEGLPFVILEAMSRGAAVIASRIAGNEAVIREEKGEGLLFPRGDESLLASHIDKVLGDASLQHHLAKCGFERVRAFSWDSIIARDVGFIEEAATTCHHKSFPVSDK